MVPPSSASPEINKSIIANSVPRTAPISFMAIAARSITAQSSRGCRVPAKKWFACIQVAGRTKSIGWFKREAEAAKAYDRAARRLWGRAAFQNFPTKHSG